MIPKSHAHVGVYLQICFAAVLALSSPPVAASTGAAEEIPWALKQELFVPVQQWASQFKESKNSAGVKNKSITFSRTPIPLEDESYGVTVHVNTALDDIQETERYELIVSKSGSKWEVSKEELKEKYVGLYRTHGASCHPFEKLSFDREGLKLSATKGSVCESYLQDGVANFAVRSDDLAFEYTPPAHASLVHTGHDFYAIHNLMARDHSDQLVFKPDAFLFRCDVNTCDELLVSSFEGLTRAKPEERRSHGYDRDSEAIADWARPLIEDVRKDRKDNVFSGFRSLDKPGHKYYSVYIPRDLADQDEGVWLTYNNWGGWEVGFGVQPKRWDLPNQVAGTLYGYYSEETLKSTDPYDLESREDQSTRWIDVYSVDGRVDLALEDSEMIEGDVEFGLTLKQDVQELPFAIISFSDRGVAGGTRTPPLLVNSIQMDGEELTWVKSGTFSGLVVLPEKMPAGSRIKLRMNFGTRALLKYTHSYTYMNRGGWMPFVSFGDTIDEFALTIRSPAKYQVLGIGHKEDDKVDGEVRTTQWRADSPVNFPTIILGRYRSDKAKFDAFKADQKTVIPVHVHVDEASFMDWGIAPKTLRPIAEQAVNSINVYTAISGIEYPFGELNLVNDPKGFLYGQAPSSLIYLGSGVFMGEGELLGHPIMGRRFTDASSIARFKRSVTAHEVGHQWWGNKIANANRRNYWFVESLAEYFSALYLEFAFGYKDYLVQVDEWRGNILESNLKANVQNADTLFAGEWSGGRGQTPARTAAIYNKGPYAFHMLRETFKNPQPGLPRGPEGADKRFFEFLRSFSQELAAKREIVTLDIQQAAEKGFGGVDADGNEYTMDLGWFFDQWIRGSGTPEFAFNYDVRRTEDGGFLIEGTVKQRVILGRTGEVLEGQTYRGVVDVTVDAKGGPFVSRLIINGPETPFRLKVPAKPLDIVLNKDNELLAYDVVVNQDF